jgi:hypothetical protein
MSLLPAEYIAALTFAVIVVAPIVLVVWNGVKQAFPNGLPVAVNVWVPRMLQVALTIGAGLSQAIAPVAPLVVAALISAFAPGWAFDFIQGNKKLKDLQGVVVTKTAKKGG